MSYVITTATAKIVALQKRIRAIQGGTGASKTISIILLLIHAAQSDTTPTLTSIVSESLPHLKKGAIREFQRIMQAHQYWKDSRWKETDHIYTFETGSQIEFFGVDDADKLRGGRRDRLFINEANNVSLVAFDELEVRTKECIYLDWNPVTEYWFYVEVYGKRDDVDYIKVNFQDNEACPPEILQSIEQRKNRPGWYKVYGLGELGEVEGKIYSGWKIIDGEIPHEARLERYGIDFGYSNDPAAIIAIYYLNGGYIFDEVAYQRGLLNNDIADILKNQSQKLAIADAAEPKSIEEIRQFGLNVMPAQKGKDSVNYGIGVIQGQRISVTRRSINLLKEYRNYLWEMDKNGKMLNEPIKGNDHCLDAARYAMTSLIPVIRQKEFYDSFSHPPAKKRVNPAL